jgi:hypothetical protein
MRRKYISLAVLVCGLIVNGVAQTTPAQETVKKSCSCGFGSINQIGVMSGENGNNLMLQTINGFRYKTWFIGAGVGIDWYHTTTIPLFLDIRKNLLAKTNSPFLYVDGGIQAMNSAMKEGTHISDDYKTSAYYDVGLGYHIGLKNNNALLMSAGYSRKSLEYTQNYWNLCPAGTCPTNKDTYKYELNRLTLKVGYRF